MLDGLGRDSIARIRMIFLVAVLAALLFVGVMPAPSLATEQASQAKTEISLWVYPIGQFGDPATVDRFIEAFNRRYPDISVTVEYLDYAYGDDQVSAAIAAGRAPDIVMEGPERIVSNWGAKGVMADLTDMWTDDTIRDISTDGTLVVDACRSSEGVYYEYPLCKSAHCMAINYEVFEKAGALQYLDLDNRTWTTEGFRKACEAVAASGLVKTPGVIYCGGQGGDQGTRALVSNLYGARFTNDEHTAYTINSPAGVHALETLDSMVGDGSLSCNGDIQAKDELALFTKGSTAMTFAWNSSNEENYASKVDFTPFAMTFPTDQKTPSLCAGIWGFGVFDNSDGARIDAAKTLIRFLCDDGEQGRQSVQATRFFPVRASLGDIYSGTPDEKRMNVYGSLLRYTGDYYNITPGWAAQRTVWWNMLRQVFSGTDPQQAADWYASIANKAIGNTAQSPVDSISGLREKHALFISSYSLNDPTVQDQIEGIQEGLGDDVNIHYEFMDSMMMSDEAYVASFYRYISDKYARINGLGAIIVGDDNALQMVVRYQEGFFRNIPVVYESVNSESMMELADSLGMTGIPARNTIEENLDLACRLLPDSTKILAISDDSAVGSALTVQLKAIGSKYAPMSVEVLDTSTCEPETITERIETTGSDAILLYLSFSSDADGKTYPYREALGLVTSHSTVPVFTLGWLGEGSLGGIAADSKAIGRQAGRRANAFLNGITPDGTTSDDVRVADGTVSTTASFDAIVMARYDINKTDLPSGSVYYNDLDDTTRLMSIIFLLAAGVIFLGIMLVHYGRDNRQRKRNERRLQKVSDVLRTEAELDVLTGLGNRRLFDNELFRSVQSNRPFTLLILDLDDFKQVNDGYGHLVGDSLLRETGSRLVLLKSRSFVPYRYGGDEFAIMLFSGQSEASQEAGQRLLELFHEKIHLDNGDIRIKVSIGSAEFPADAKTTEGLIDCADRALYAAKSAGKDNLKRFQELQEDAIPGNRG